MSKFYVTILGLFVSIAAFAQSGSAKGEGLPPFRLMLTNGKFLDAKDLPQDKPVVVIYFAPDCDHCIVLMDAFFKKITDFKNASVVLATFKPSADLIPFEKKYQTARYANMVVGTEGYTFYLRNHYRLQRTPFVAIYNRQKKLACSFRDKTPVPEIIGCIKTIQ